MYLSVRERKTMLERQTWAGKDANALATPVDQSGSRTAAKLDQTGMLGRLQLWASSFCLSFGRDAADKL